MIKIRYYTPVMATLIFVGTIAILSEAMLEALDEAEWHSSITTVRTHASRTQGFVGEMYELGEDVGVRKALSQLYFHHARSKSAITDSSGKIIYSNALGLEGQPLQKLPFPVQLSAFEKAIRERRPIVIKSDDALTLTAYYPVSMSRSGEEPYSKTGALLINYHVDERLAENRARVRQAAVAVAPAIIVILLAVMALLHFGLNRRVQAFQRAVRDYLGGNTSSRVRMGWRDEISEIGDAFNQLADDFDAKQEALALSNKKLAEFAGSLELEVQERTEKLLESQTELKSILALAPDGIILIGLKGEIMRFNQAAEGMFGWQEQEVLGHNVSMLMPGTERAAHDQYLANFRTTGQSRIVGVDRELLAQRRDGTHFPIEISVNNVTVNGKEAFIAVLRDNSVRRAAEKALEETRASLVESERMAALGNLVAGVAHEINTPVGIGVTAASHLREEIEAFSELYRGGKMKRSDLEALLETGHNATSILESNLHRASDLIRSFKEISVDQTGDDERTVQLSQYVGQILTTLQPKYKNRPITIDVDIDEDIEVRLRPGAISQILTNCVVNSLVHAFDLEDSGTIRIAAQRSGDGLILTYADDGCGLSSESAARIFEPFYTTKRGAGGSGLGMNIVYNIVTAKFGGKITCRSAPGQGILITMTIPNCMNIGKNT